MAHGCSFRAPNEPSQEREECLRVILDAKPTDPPQPTKEERFVNSLAVLTLHPRLFSRPMPLLHSLLFRRTLVPGPSLDLCWVAWVGGSCENFECSNPWEKRSNLRNGTS